MKLVIVENQPRLCLFANRDIEKGEELRYDYGEPDLPWRTVYDLMITMSFLMFSLKNSCFSTRIVKDI